MPVFDENNPEVMRNHHHAKPAYVITTIVQITVHADSPEKARQILELNPLYSTLQAGMRGVEYWSGTGQIVSITRKE